jgi:hypothetical protein
MSSDGALDVRPRTAGEILDDAWRLSLSDAPRLFVLNGLFTVPAFSLLFLLLAWPAPHGLAGLLLPVLTAFALPLTGLGSGACQELFRRRSEGKPVRLSECLVGALRRGPEHAAARAVVSMIVLIVLLPLLLGWNVLLVVVWGALLIVPLLSLWTASAPIHALLAGKGSLSELGRETAFAPGKAAAVTLSRAPLLLLVFLNLYVFIAVGLWVGDNLCGFDLAFAGAVLSLGNPAYVTALVLFSWLLLTPYFETSNFLLHSDTRTRREGLDLLYRVQRLFPLPDKPASPRASAISRKVGTLAVLALSLSLASPLSAGEPPADAVKAVCKGVEVIAGEIKDAEEPFPGSRRWEPRLTALGDRLEKSGDGDVRRYRWYREALDGFGERNRNDALTVLSGLHSRLSVLEETLNLPRNEPGAPVSKEDVKQRVRPRRGESDDGKDAPTNPEKDDPKHKDVPRDNPNEGENVNPGAGPKGPGIITPAAGVGGGFGLVGWALLGGLLVAMLVVALVFFIRSRRGAKPMKARQESGPADEEASRQELPHEQPASEWWRRAEELARQGRYLDAVRSVYLAVLSLLHRQQLLRYETTRTNGEYIDQVRLSPQAPPALTQPFERLVTLFEAKWYGERACELDEFRACRALAEEIQGLVVRHG